jgi:hypothetical protein
MRIVWHSTILISFMMYSLANNMSMTTTMMTPGRMFYLPLRGTLTVGRHHRTMSVKTFTQHSLALRPSEPVAKYLHDVAESKGVHLMYGELVLLNSIINNWFHLPRYTLVAQSEKARPTVGNDSSNGNIMDAVVDWSQVKVYDFAGPPATKPWRNYWLQKKTGDKYAHEYLGRVTPGMEAYHIGMYPQWVWNEYYDAVLQRKDSYNHQASNEDEL